MLLILRNNERKEYSNPSRSNFIMFIDKFDKRADVFVQIEDNINFYFPNDYGSHFCVM